MIQLKSLILFVTCLFSFSFSQGLNSFLSEDELNTIKEVQPLIHNADFTDAEILIDKSKSKINSDLFLFLMQVNYFWKYTYTKNDSFLVRSISYAEKNVYYLEKNDSDDDLRNRFFLGASYGYWGLSLMNQKRIMSAIGYAKDGYKILKDIYSKDSTFYEVGFGIGLFEGLASKVPFVLKWITYLIGFDGDYDIAIAHLEKASRKGLLTRGDAMFFYYGLIDEDTKQKKALLDSLRNNYPRNPVFRYMKARDYYDDEKYAEGIDELETKVGKLDDSFSYLKRSMYFYLGECYFKINNPQKSNEHLLKAVKYYKQYGKNLDKVYYYISQNYLKVNDKKNSEKYLNMVKDKDEFKTSG